MQINIEAAAKEFFPHLTPACGGQTVLDITESFVKRGCPGAVRFPEPRRRKSPLQAMMLMAAAMSMGLIR